VDGKLIADDAEDGRGAADGREEGRCVGVPKWIDGVLDERLGEKGPMHEHQDWRRAARVSCGSSSRIKLEATY
jgi:hypothetical protein